MRAWGVDGCKAGWIAIARDGDDGIDARCVATAAELFEATPHPDIVAIDVPIGLPDAGLRACDREARRLLGPRRSSVFSAPLRGLLAARSWEEACAIRRRIESKGMSKQAWGIVAKIREVDALLRSRPALRGRIREVHPELSFRIWRGEDLAHSKKQAAGRRERRDLVDPHFGVGAFDAARAVVPRKHAADDDLLDAFAALWSAERILRGEAVALPAWRVVDGCGVGMEIVY